MTTPGNSLKRVYEAGMLCVFLLLLFSFSGKTPLSHRYSHSLLAEKTAVKQLSAILPTSDYSHPLTQKSLLLPFLKGIGHAETGADQHITHSVRTIPSCTIPVARKKSARLYYHLFSIKDDEPDPVA